MAIKKSILITIGSIALTTGIVATAVCVPAYVNVQGNNPKLYNFQPNAHGSLMMNALDMGAVNVSFKEAVLGTTKINHGTYFIYLGSQAYTSNNEFLYGANNASPMSFEANQNLQLNGYFGQALNQINTLQVRPQVLMMQDVLTPAVYKEQLNYNNQVKTWKAYDMSSDKLTRQQRQQHAWAISAPEWSFAPGKTYINWEGKTTYFRTDKYATEFQNAVNFVNKRFKNVKDVSGSSGIIIGYKDGNICSNYTGSFNGSSDSSSSSTAATTQSNQFFTAFKPQLLADHVESTNLEASSTAASNDFLNWLQNNYGISNESK
ncbi:hypothetical protein [Ureaplasma ceti]|uniref:Uncharacterized protein n=1 Tax=Ureaplasma ceti TaxID=3119530 RepID=A0ABP9UAX3_9BACT